VQTSRERAQKSYTFYIYIYTLSVLMRPRLSPQPSSQAFLWQVEVLPTLAVSPQLGDQRWKGINSRTTGRETAFYHRMTANFVKRTTVKKALGSSVAFYQRISMYFAFQ